MDRKIHEALKKTIKKWESISDGIGIDEGHDNCALCELLVHCAYCPVRLETHASNCINSPYADWSYHQSTVHRRNGMKHDTPRFCLCSRCRQLAIEELEFLKSLLPKED